jgi:hypothetical protein
MKGERGLVENAKLSNWEEGDYKIMYGDINNLYGAVMCMKLPLNNFKDVSDEVWTTERIMNLDNGDTGYLFKVDFEYPKELHKRDYAFPLAPEHLDKKLKCTLLDKKEYVVHFLTLQYYVQRGLIIKKVHRAISFYQCEFMKPYILRNTEWRDLAKLKGDDFLIMLFKLLNNVIYGKTVQNNDNKFDHKTARTPEKWQKYFNNARMKNYRIFSDNFALFRLTPKYSPTRNPIQIGWAILELAKLLLYKMYDNINEKYCVKLLYTDTDSLVFQMFQKTGYKRIEELDNEPFMNGKILGAMKEEHKNQITDFCVLKSKCYNFIIFHDGKRTTGCKNKGLPKMVNDQLTFDCFKSVLIEEEEFIKGERNDITKRIASFCKIECKKNEISTVEIKKKLFDASDDKKVRVSFNNYAPIGFE